jgi:hypothetical protein
MPMFYLRPFKFNPEEKPSRFDSDMSELVLYGVIGLIGIAMFVTFVVLPAVLTVAEAAP